MKDSDSFVLDISFLREGDCRQYLSGLSPRKILASHILLAYLDFENRSGEYQGFVALEELGDIKGFCAEKGIGLELSGQKTAPGRGIRIDEQDVSLSSIDLAYETSSVLLTSDRITEKMAMIKGVSVLMTTKATEPPGVENFFDENTMSIHLRENSPPMAKKGRPGDWTYSRIHDEPMSQQQIKEIASSLTGEGVMIEHDREGSAIIQKGNFRIVVIRPPFSDGWEITAVRPVRLLRFEEYALSDKLRARIENQAEGILVAGSPGQGKTTFARAMAIHYADSGKVVKTVEAPRDLILPENITQLAISHGSPDELNDILLLTRPDYTVFDEMRNTEDFRLFSDLRLSGVGMIGIVHATSPIDSIQRFIGRIDLGVIPQVIDTVIFISAGIVQQVFEVRMTVKVPQGMIDSDLARPVVTVSDFETGKIEYEIYTYGEETVVIPAAGLRQRENAQVKYAEEALQKRIEKISKDAKVEMVSADRCNIYVPEEEIAAIIGKNGERVRALEEELEVKIDIQKLPKVSDPVKYGLSVEKRYITITPARDVSGREIEIYVDGGFVLSAHVSKKNIIKISRHSEQGKSLQVALSSGKAIELRA